MMMRLNIPVNPWAIPTDNKPFMTDDVSSVNFLFSERSEFVEIKSSLIDGKYERILIPLSEFLVLAHAAIVLDETKNGKTAEQKNLLSSINNALQVDAVFADWQDKKGESIYYTQAGSELGVGVFHHGSTFPASIQLDVDDKAHLETAMKAGYTPVFAFFSKANNEQ